MRLNRRNYACHKSRDIGFRAKVERSIVVLERISSLEMVRHTALGKNPNCPWGCQ